MTALQFLADSTANDAIREKLREFPNRVYFPNFGKGDNIFKEGIDIDRVLFTVPGTNFKIYWYGFLITIGILLAMIYGFRRMKTVGIDPDRATDSVIGGLIGAIFGARFYYIIFNTEGMKFSEFFDIRDGGLAIYGGLIGAIIVGGIIAKVRKLKLTALLDVVAPCFLIGQCIGRWGNFFNQEAFGANTKLPWGMISNTTMEYISNHYDELGGKVSALDPIHPCFLYESIWCLIGFIILHFYLKHRKFDGEVFLMYTGWYGLGRFFIEGLRTDSLYLGNIRVSQLVAGTCVLASLVLIIVFRGITKRNSDYKLFVDTELSKAQLEQYNSYNDMQQEKKELKHKIKEAKDKGESFIELQKEYDEKFGKQAQKDKLKEAEEKDKESHTKAETEYKSILGDDNDERLVEYLSELAGYTTLPIILYEFPGMQPCNMSGKAYGELVKTGRFYGIKDTTCTMAGIKDKIAVQGDSAVLQANIPLLFDAYMAGARGVCATPTSCGANLFRKMYDEFFVEKDIAKARETFNEIILLDNAIDSGFNASAKYLVSLQGIPMTTVTRTGSSVNEARRRSIEAYYEYAKEHGMLK